MADVLIIDPSQTVYQDLSGGTTTAAGSDGNPVGTVHNRASGSSVKFTTSTSGKRLVYKTAGGPNGQPYLQANSLSTPTSRLTANANITLPASLTLFVVANQGNATRFYRSVMACENRVFLGSGFGGNFCNFYGNGSGWSSTQELGANWPLSQEWVLFVVRQLGSTIQAYANGTNCKCGSRADAFTSAAMILELFNNAAEDQPWDGGVALLHACDLLSEADAETQAATYRSRFGIANPSTLVIPTLTRYAGNPVTARGGVGAFDHTDCANPAAFRDTPNSRLVKNYSGWNGVQWGTGLSYSTDEGGNWTKEAANPVFTPSVAEGIISANGSILFKSPDYELAYQGAAGGGAQIYLAKSTDLLTWTRQFSGAALSGLKDTNASDYFDPDVRLLTDGVTREITYTQQNGAPNRWATVKTTTDWSTFTEVRRFPIGWSTAGAGEPAYWEALNLYIHDALIPGETVKRQLYVARPFGVGGWATDPSYVLLTPSGSGFDAVQVFDSCPVPGTNKILFAGAAAGGLDAGMGSDIGFATYEGTMFPPLAALARKRRRNRYLMAA